MNRTDAKKIIDVASALSIEVLGKNDDNARGRWVVVLADDEEVEHTFYYVEDALQALTDLHNHGRIY